jgi:hypothetical protein
MTDLDPGLLIHLRGGFVDHPVIDQHLARTYQSLGTLAAADKPSLPKEHIQSSLFHRVGRRRPISTSHYTNTKDVLTIHTFLI